MNERSLSALYRRLTLGKPLALDADTLASAADGTLASEGDVAEALAGSPREAALVRMRPSRASFGPAFVRILGTRSRRASSTDSGRC